MASSTYLAVDLGASSGRVMAGRFDGKRIALEELHRFENGPVRVGETIHWDALRLWSSIQEGLSAAGARHPHEVASIGVDTWGVDFALLGAGDTLLGNPIHYRDARTRGIFDQTFPTVSRETIFAETGIQFLEFNTLFQLYAMRLADSPLLDAAESLLMMPDLFHWMMTGEKSCELTDASTTQLYNPVRGEWSESLISRLGLPRKIFNEISPPGTSLGALASHVAEATNLHGAQVVLPGAHDTGSAVVAVPSESSPADRPKWCYISSGTWSLMGVETPNPVINAKSLEYNFTNEAGVGGTTRLLKNIGGLWLVQECRRVWRQNGRDYSWDELTALAKSAKPLESVVPPDDPRLLAPADMPNAIAEICSETGQPIPESPGAFVRSALESIAIRYRQVLAMLEELTGGSFATIHIVGGGSKNELLCQMTADATNRHVLTGPVEATCIGNLLVQAITAGQIDSVADAREVVRASFDVKEFTPQDSNRWAEAAARLDRFAN